MDADVAVVGAGPAGTAAALSLARRGLHVALLEKHRLPRDKVCGDALIPDALAALERLGLADEIIAAGHEAEALRLYAPNGTPCDVPGRLVCLRRRELDTRLARAAAAAGADLREGVEVTGFEADDRRATLALSGDTGAPTLTARVVILAGGASSETLQRFGLPHRRAPSALAARTYYRLPADAPQDRLHLWYERSILPGYGWAFPMGDHVFNVGVGVFRDTGPSPANLRELFARFEHAATSLLAGGEALEPFTGAPLRTALTGCPLAADRLLVIGEAIGTTYSFTGEGIGKAMETGMLAADVAADALLRDALGRRDLAAYANAVQAAMSRRFADYLRAQRWLRHPFVMNLVVRRAARGGWARQRLMGILGERDAPGTLFSAWGLLRATLG
jgi:geranylgeranyl reductase family protein